MKMNKTLIIASTTAITTLIIFLGVLWYMDSNKCRTVTTKVTFPNGTVQEVESTPDVRCLDDMNKKMSGVFIDIIPVAYGQVRDKLILCIKNDKVTGIYPYRTTDLSTLTCDRVSLVYKDDFCDDFDSPICKN